MSGTRLCLVRGRCIRCSYVYAGCRTTPACTPANGTSAECPCTLISHAPYRILLWRCFLLPSFLFSCSLSVPPISSLILSTSAEELTIVMQSSAEKVPAPINRVGTLRSIPSNFNRDLQGNPTFAHPTHLPPSDHKTSMNHAIRSHFHPSPPQVKRTADSVIDEGNQRAGLVEREEGRRSFGSGRPQAEKEESLNKFTAYSSLWEKPMKKVSSEESRNMLTRRLRARFHRLRYRSASCAVVQVRQSRAARGEAVRLVSFR
jgi:hypothetical protein